MTLAEFLMERLEKIGVGHVFGIPGDYVLDFYEKLWKNNNIEVINTTDEAHAGFAADAYARMNGVGCVTVTYNVGALKVANAVACAYAERSPMILISGSPGMKEREDEMLLHHMVRSFNCQKEIFEKITCASVVLDNPTTAGYKLDQAFEALKHYKQPIYIELPRDLANKPMNYDPYMVGTPKQLKSDPTILGEALEEVKEWLGSAKNPAILAGVELARYGLGEKLVKFAERTNIPVATELLSKSVINERNPLYAGLYSGPSSHESTRTLIDDSDCLLMFGVMLTDISLNFLPARFAKRQVISASVEGLKIKNHNYPKVLFSDFCEALFKTEFTTRSMPELRPVKEKVPFVANADKAITTSRMFEMINSILHKDMSIIADIGDSLFGAGDLTVHHSNTFLSPAFYTSMGFAIPGALGAHLAKPNLRPIVILGDGAFQMSCTELSTIVQRGLNPIIFLLNNQGYGTERLLRDGDFNNIRNWQYHRIVDMIGGGEGFLVKTEADLEAAVKKALASKQMSLLNVVVDKNDVSEACRRMVDPLKKKI